MKILLTVEELAKYLKIKPDTIYKKVRRGELPAIKLGKLVRFPKDAIDQWISDQTAKTMKTVKEVEARVEHAVRDVRAATEKAATEVRKTAKKVIKDVPEIVEDLRKAPLEKKQEVLTKGFKTLLKDVQGKMAEGRARAKRVVKAKAKRVVKSKPKAVRSAAAPASTPVAAAAESTTTESK